tara:strand:+ start:2989 stop:3321 length:333 start_codon:yes stop_codon:yes gene_type:complete
MSETVIDGTLKYIEHLKKDYKDWGNVSLKNNTQMIKEFADGLGFSEGQKYIKVTKDFDSSVHSFIVNTDKDKKFDKGDILKAASWKAPARNFARGNVLRDDFIQIRWVGA